MSTTLVQSTYTDLATDLILIAQKADQLRAVQADLTDLLAEYQPIVAARLNNLLDEEIDTLERMAELSNQQLQLKLAEPIEDKLGLGQGNRVIVA